MGIKPCFLFNLRLMSIILNRRVEVEVLLLKRRLKKASKKTDDIKEENYKISQQIANMGSWTRDLVNEEIYFSDEFYRIIECSPKDIKGNLEKYYSFLHPDDLDEYKKIKYEEKQGIEHEVDYRIKTPTGTIKYLYEKTKAIYTEDNKAIRMVGIIHDITDRKIVEKNLKEIGDNLNQAQRVAGVGSWKYDVKEDANFWSEEVYNIFNIDPAKFDRSLKLLLKLVHPEDRQRFHDDFKEALKGKGYKHDYRIPQADGSVKYVSSKGQPIFEGNKVVGIIGVIQDVTENKVLQNKLVEYNNRIRTLERQSSDVFF